MKSQVTLLLVCLISIFKASAQNRDFGNMSYKEALNLSENQAILSQEISKIKMVNAAEISTPELEEQIATAISTFEKNFKTLKSNSKTTSLHIKTALGKEQLKWLQFKRTIQSPIVFVNQLLDVSEELLLECNNVSDAISMEAERRHLITYTKKNSRKKAFNINMLEKQNVLMQKFCTYYAASQILDKGDDHTDALNKYVYLFDNINATITALENTELASDDVLEIISEMKELSSGLFKKKKELLSAKIPLEKVLATTDEMVVLLDKVENVYSSY